MNTPEDINFALGSSDSEESWRYIKHNTLTPMQLKTVITHTQNSATIKLVLATQPIDEDNFRRLFDEWPYTTFGFERLEPWMIDIGLEVHDRPTIVRMAYHHPCCTDAQRVKHNLTYGEL